MEALLSSISLSDACEEPDAFLLSCLLVSGELDDELDALSSSDFTDSTGLTGEMGDLVSSVIKPSCSPSEDMDAFLFSGVTDSA